MNDLPTIPAGVSTTHLCDVVDNIRILNGDIQQITPHDHLMAGPAYTVESKGDLLPIIVALNEAPEGSVIVISGDNSPYALAGEIFATTAKKRKIAGIVIDGFCRDKQALRKIGLPFFARGTFPKAGSKHNIGKQQSLIVCGGAVIHPGEIVLGDQSGLVVIEPPALKDAFSLAKQLEEKEQASLQRLQAGEKISSIFNMDEHIAKLKEGIPSNLRWTL